MNNNKRKAIDGIEDGRSPPIPDNFVKLILGNDTLVIQRDKLAQVSSFFQSMLTPGNFEEEFSRSIVIHTPNAQDIQCAHRVLVAALYDGINLHVDEDNAEQILRVAHYFDLTAFISKASNELKTSCAASCDPFLEQCGKFSIEINLAAALEDLDAGYNFREGYKIWRVARDLGVNDLQQVVLARLQVHMGFLVHPSVFKFKDCTFDEVLALVSGSFLGVESEKVVLDAVLAWCSHDRSARWNYDTLSRLLPELRWEHLEGDIRTLMILAQEPLPAVLKAILKNTQPHFANNQSVMNRNLPCPQRHWDEFLFFMHSQKRQLYMGQYRPRNDYLHNKNTAVDGDVEEYEPWMLIVEGQIWMCVKRKKGRYLVTFNPETGRFQRLPMCIQQSVTPLLELPIRLAPLYWDGHIYLLDRKQRTLCVCDAAGMEGHTGYSLPHQLRNETGWDIWDGHIYVCSRFTVHFDIQNVGNSPPCGRVDKFSLDSGLWTECSPAGTGNRPIGFMSIKAHNGYIYSTGGKCLYDNSLTTGCYRYHLANGTWSSFARSSNLQSARREHATFVINDRLFVIGGYGERNLPVTTMEMYDEAKDCWTVIRDCVYATGCAVVRTKAFASVKVDPAEIEDNVVLEGEDQ